MDTQSKLIEAISKNIVSLEHKKFTINMKLDNYEVPSLGSNSDREIFIRHIDEQINFNKDLLKTIQL